MSPLVRYCTVTVTTVPLQADIEKQNVTTCKTLYRVPEQLSLLTGTKPLFYEPSLFKAALSVHVIAITMAGY